MKNNGTLKITGKDINKITTAGKWIDDILEGGKTFIPTFSFPIINKGIDWVEYSIYKTDMNKMDMEKISEEWKDYIFHCHINDDTCMRSFWASWKDGSEYGYGSQEWGYED